MNNSVLSILEDALNRLPEELEKKAEDKEKENLRRYLAARTIQRWVRGHLTRLHLLGLHLSATIIQCHWRGYLGRKLYLKILRVQVDELCWRHYKDKATLIQKTWRGYFVRNNVFDFYKFKAWLNGVTEKNEYVIRNMKNLYEEQKSILNAKQEENAFVEALYSLFKMHHLLRTVQIPGIYSLHSSMKLSELEMLLTHLKFKEYMMPQKKENLTTKQKLKFHKSSKMAFEKWLQCWDKNIDEIKTNWNINSDIRFKILHLKKLDGTSLL